MKLNHFKCPNCGHDWYEDSCYGTCDKCGTFFYLAQAYFVTVIIQTPTVVPYDVTSTPADGNTWYVGTTE